ncbi:WD40 repeat domain-containing protein [Candidatus Roizmanbacteria bacterium]|nr:WD40 repeat domain-containing protein [Candidatus Roizmanbacteria bacterium]
MKKIILLLLFIIFCSSSVFAELKPFYNIVEKLTEAETRDAPRLYGNVVYPGFGVPCTKFTYRVMYQDEKGRAPEYVRINLNNKGYNMEKKKGDYKTGTLYTYEYIPTSTKNNFFYFEASNGVGKARAAIIDSPDQGPTIFSEKFDNNQIILLDKDGNEIWTYDTSYDQVEGVAISSDGNYVAVVTNVYVYLFSKDNKEPLWKFCTNCVVPEIISTNMAGIAISADGKYIAADLQNTLYFFNRESNKPLWVRDTESSALGIDMSNDGSLIASGVANLNGKGDKIFLYNKEGTKLWEYRAEHPGYDQTGNFYHPDMTPDGNFIAVSTGCPDRRAYIFSKKKDLLFRSEQLTFDSPVHESAISDDGSLAAYSADHNTGKEIVFLFNRQGNKLWSFSSQEDATSRGVSISADGEYIAAGTSAGNIYLFSKGSNKPLWKFSDSKKPFVQIGEVKLNSDGSLLAAAGTSKKIYMFSKESNKPLWEYKANTWVTKLDFNGKYIVAGTGLREYGGEGATEEKEFTCTEIIEPPSMEEMEGQVDRKTEEDYKGRVVCGDGICIPNIENSENCPQDCCGENCDEPKIKETKEKRIVKESEKLIAKESEKLIVKEPEKEKRNLFQIIINFFRGLFK